MSKTYIVQLEEGVWISDYGLTLVRPNAKKYKSISSATFALAWKRKLHDFKKAEIQEDTND